MKANIHPKWFDTKVTCACGNEFTVGSTIPSVTVDVCSNCHPFYTGQVKFVDTKGRVDAFIAKQQGKKVRVSKSERRAAKRAARVEMDLNRPESLSELRNAFSKK